MVSRESIVASTPNASAVFHGSAGVSLEERTAIDYRLEDMSHIRWPPAVPRHDLLKRLAPRRGWLGELDGPGVSLAGEGSSYLTGQLFVVDGGRTII